MKVDFTVCGTQKGGTTALDSYLRTHPELSMASTKEVHFFDQDSYFDQGVGAYDDYHKFFTNKSSGQKLGEATPIYMYWKGAMERMREYNQEMKIILILRNPIARAFSHWNMESKRGAEELSFMDALLREGDRLASSPNEQHRVYSYCDRGFYTKQIKNIWSLFDGNNVHIIKSENLIRSPKETLAGVYNFLEVNPNLGDLRSMQKHKIPYDAAMSAVELDYLRGVFKDEVGALAELLSWDCEDWV